MTSPPPTTRAQIRGKFIAHFSGHGNATVDWTVLKLDDTYSVKLLDPYATEDETVDYLIEKKSKAA
jgi:hypothetical protein